MLYESSQAREIVTALDRGPYGDLLRDTSSRRRIIFETMATSGDPLTREVGQQLLGGATTPRELLQREEYRTFFSNALTKAEQFDMQRVRDDVEAVAADQRLTGDLAQDLDATARTEAVDDAGDQGHRTNDRR